MSRAKRPTQDYLAAALALSALIPGLKKYKRRKKLKPQEKSAIALKERAARGAYNLTLLSPKQVKFFKKHDLLYKGRIITKRAGREHVREIGGFHAIQLTNTGEKPNIKIVNNRFFLETNGRVWLYDMLRPEMKPIGPDVEDEEREENKEENLETMEGRGRNAFETPIREAFPLEKIIRLAERAFKSPVVKKIGLWTTKGRVGEVFNNFKEFSRWVYRDFSTYQNVERWVNGIAILIADVGDNVPDAVWRKGYDQEEIRKRRKDRRAKWRKSKGQIA